MARTLEKTRKEIAKKKRGTIEVLHENSRDSKRLRRAQVRDDRLEKIAEARRKKDQPLRSCPPPKRTRNVVVCTQLRLTR